MNPTAHQFPIVCVGGSAGGLDAYIGLLRNLPAEMGMGTSCSTYDATTKSYRTTSLSGGSSGSQGAQGPAGARGANGTAGAPGTVSIVLRR